MSGGQVADEVAEDYKAALEFLTSNDRYAINNYTVIAKENTEYADAISRVLIEHITKARSDHKLPALYVLDSIAKNIGTPYTLFLGAKLYSTFMDAYSQVDRVTRKKLDEMLKTWKSPVPGSIDSRPVFPPEITVKIENALLKVKTKTLEYEQQQQRQHQELFQRRGLGGTSFAQQRNTPTPPQQFQRYPAPQAGSQGIATQQTHMTYPSPAPYQQQFGVAPSAASAYHHPPDNNVAFSPPPGALAADLASLRNDIDALVVAMREEFARNYQDISLQTRLKALLDLQSIVHNRGLPPDQLPAVRQQVHELQASFRGHEAVQGYSYGATPVQEPYAAPPRQTPVSVAPPSSNMLADLLASVERSRQATEGAVGTPGAIPTAPQPPVVPVMTPQTSNGPAGLPLLAQLRAAGLIGEGTPAASNAAGAPAAGVASTPAAPSQSTAKQPSMNLSDLLKGVAVPRQSPDDVEMSTASLKIPRPQLIHKLYDARPNACLTCGRRFAATAEGKAAKAKHLDWHYDTNQRIIAAAQRGQSRSWYVDELDWIRYRGNEEGTGDGLADGEAGTSGANQVAAKSDPKSKYVRVPADKTLVEQPCPICQDKFETTWNEEVQDFVWMDAVQVGGRILHASCYAEYQKAGSNTPGRTATPDSTLGKRKLEDSVATRSPAKSVRAGPEQ